MPTNAETISRDQMFSADVIGYVFGSQLPGPALTELADISERFVELRFKLHAQLKHKSFDDLEELLKLTGEAARRLGSRLPKYPPSSPATVAAVALASSGPRSGGGLEGGAALASRRQRAAPLRRLYVPVTRKVSLTVGTKVKKLLSSQALV